MLKALSLLLLFSLSFGGELYYCVQLASSNKAQPLLELLEDLKRFPDARVERIKGLYTLRVGYFKSKREAGELLPQLKGVFPDAFVRRCAYKPERIVHRKEEEVREEESSELLQLITSALIGAGRLNDALKVARRALELYPNDPYWLETYGNLLLWTGKTNEALLPLLKAYKLTKKRKLAKRIYSLALALGRYEVAKEVMHSAGASAKEIEEVYRTLGELDELIKFLKGRRDKHSLISLAEILFALGRKEEALEAVSEAEKLYGLEPHEVLLKVEILYSMRRFSDALLLMKRYAGKVPEDFPEFWSMFSDIAWMLGDYESAKSAVLKLILWEKAKPGDYYRALDLLEDEPSKAISVALRAWEKFRLLPFLERALSVAYKHRMWEEVVRIARRYPELVRRRDYALSYLAGALVNLGKKEEAYRIVERRLKEKPTDYLLTFYIYLLIENKETTRLERVVRKFKRKSKDIPLPFIYAYIFLKKGKEAHELYKEAGVEDELLLADIFYLLGREDESRNLRFSVFRKMKKRVRENPQLLTEPEFLREFLYVGMDFIKEGAYERLLLSARDVLDEKVWKELYLSFLFRKSRYPEILFLVRRKDYPLQPWMEVNLFLYLNDTTALKDVLIRRPQALSTRDRVEALRRVKAYSQALYYAFLGLEDNPEDYQLYKQMRDLVVESEDKLSVRSSLLLRKAYTESRTDLTLHLRNLQKGFGGGLSLSFMSPLSRREDLLRKAPAGYRAGVFIERLFERSRLRAEGGVFSRLEPVLYGRVSYEVYELFRTYLRLEGVLSGEPHETLYLYLGGLKDYVSVSAVHNLTNRLYLLFEGEKSFFFSPDRTKEGEGLSFVFSINHKVRVNYPDYTFKLFYEFADFMQKSRRGSIREILPGEGFTVIPASYKNIGGGFLFGYENRDYYTRVWRPFVDVSFGHNTKFGFFVNVSGGIGGQLLDKDHLYIEGALGRNMGGVQETILNLGVGYNRWF
ncbi:MAG: tetratricopeptide repeat protein [Aquificae bacterium]|nr:tetratricopeptide repeat protein [Aquificota bacterium]